MVDQLPVTGLSCSRQRLHGLVEFGGGDQRLLPFRFERVLYHTRGEELDLVLRGTPIGVLERHHLALFGDAHPALNGTGRLRSDGATGRSSTPTHRATSAMEKRDRDSGFLSQPSQLDLRL